MFEKLQEKLKDLTTGQQQAIESALLKAAEEIVSSPAFSKTPLDYWSPTPGEEVWIWHRPGGYAYSVNYLQGGNNRVEHPTIRLDGNIHKTREDAVLYGQVYNAKRKYISLARKSFENKKLDWLNNNQDKYYAVVDRDRVSYSACCLSNHMVICFASKDSAKEAVEELGLEMMQKIADFPW